MNEFVMTLGLLGLVCVIKSTSDDIWDNKHKKGEVLAFLVVLVKW